MIIDFAEIPWWRKNCVQVLSKGFKDNIKNAQILLPFSAVDVDIWPQYFENCITGNFLNTFKLISMIIIIALQSMILLFFFGE